MVEPHSGRRECRWTTARRRVVVQHARWRWWSHILADAEDLCDHVTILNRGKRIADGDTKQLLAEQPGMSLEDYFFHKVDEDNRRRLSAAEAEASMRHIREEAVPTV